MTREELSEKLVENGFEFWRNDEFHRDEYRNKSVKVKIGQFYYLADLAVTVDYYTVRIVWWLDGSHKVSSSYYLKRDISNFVSVSELFVDFLHNCSQMYSIDLNKYKI